MESIWKEPEIYRTIMLQFRGISLPRTSIIYQNLCWSPGPVLFNSSSETVWNPRKAYRAWLLHTLPAPHPTTRSCSASLSPATQSLLVGTVASHRAPPSGPRRSFSPAAKRVACWRPQLNPTLEIALGWLIHEPSAHSGDRGLTTRRSCQLRTSQLPSLPYRCFAWGHTQ